VIFSHDARGFGAVGTGELALNAGAGAPEGGRVEDGAVEVALAELDRGVEHEIEQRYECSLSLFEAVRTDVLPVYRPGRK
jgi:hypothetical protein